MASGCTENHAATSLAVICCCAVYIPNQHGVCKAVGCSLGFACCVRRSFTFCIPDGSLRLFSGFGLQDRRRQCGSEDSHIVSAGLCVFVSAGEGVEVEVEVGGSGRLSGVWCRALVGPLLDSG
jgi:hypothetical protein